MNIKRTLASLAVLGVAAMAGTAQAAPYTFLQAGYTAEVVAVYPSFIGGIAFAADGDILADTCAFSGSPLIRWDVQAGTTLVNGSSIYTSVTSQASNAGCGLTTHSNGDIYSNTSGGVVRLSDTGAQIGVGGVGGNALGITEDPLTGELYYVGSNNDIRRVTPDLVQVDGAFANNGGFTDGIYWNPDGSLLYTTDRTANSLDVFARDGTLVSSTALGREPDGVAFALAGFVLTNNTDGTISRINSDGTVELFASGGFRGDLAHVGPDGCWYLSQAGTRYDNGTISGSNSIVRICADGGGGFNRPPGTGGGGTPVPEPATLSLAALGLTLIGLSRRRRRPGDRA